MSTAAEIVKDALLLIQATSANRDVDGNTLTQSVRMMNRLLANWANKGWIPWKLKDVVLPLIDGQQSYLLGNASTDAEWATSDDFVSTTLSAAALAAATSVTVTSATGLAVGDRIGIELDAGTRQWTTVNTISGTTISLLVSGGLTGAAASGNSFYAYTARPARPLRVVHARRRTSSTDIPVRIEAMERYNDRPNKSTSGVPTEVYYRPTLTSGTLYVWQPASSVDDQLRLTVETAFDVAEEESTSVDVTTEAELALAYRLADLLEPSYGQLDGRRAQTLKMEANRLESEAFAFALDQGPIRFVTRRGRW